jgi:hypothetical protein
VRIPFFLGTLLAAALPHLRAQAPEPSIVVVGTTIQSPLDGSHWGYLSWLASSPELLRDRPYAVYLKDGAADDPLPQFRHVGTVRPQTDPATIQTLFERARHLGQDRAKLDEAISGYFDQLHPGGGVPVPDMFGALTAESLQDDNIFQMLVLMGRAHPGVALSLGTGFAARIHNGTSTFELREKAPGSGEFSSVVGRVTVTAGNPPVFPAPGPPVAVPSVDRNGSPLPAGDVTNHMNVKLRWASLDELRRQSLLLRGYHVYRVSRAYAEANGWHNCPAPALAALDWDAEVAAAFPQVAKVNRLPILPRRFYNDDEVVDFNLDEGDGVKGDLDFYTQDDNRHNGLAFDADGESFDRNAVFVPGAEFYYYAVCEDLLGRKGAASCGTLVKVCDRAPPVAPKRVQVTNDFAYAANNQSEQRLRVSWQALPDSENAVAYFVYRWRSLLDHKAAQNADPLSLGPGNLVAGPIAHTAGGETLSVLDNADPAHSPKIGADPQFGAAGDDAGQTIWYTVVAVDDSSCGGNFSPHSAPASGVLRDRAAPLGGGGSLLIRCCSVAFEGDRDSQQSTQLPEPADPQRLTFELTVTRAGSRPEVIRQAEFWLYDEKNNLTFPIAIEDFPENSSLPLVVRAGIPRPDPLDGTYFLQGRVINDDGRESQVASVSLPNFPTRFLHLGTFVATRACGIRTLTIDQFSDCDTHEAVAEDDEETIPVEVELVFPFAIREWRLYRSVNDGPLTLAKQGVLGTASQALDTLKVQDLIFAIAGGEVCYFAQYFDEHGNGGPMKELGCMKFTGLSPKTPSLARIRPVEDGGNLKAQVRWFCPTFGVEYFEVHVTRSSGQPPDNLSPSLVKDGTTVIKVGALNGVPILRTGKRYRTGIVGGDLPNSGPQFSIELDHIALDETYHVTVAAVGRNGKKSKRSNIEPFVWETPVEVILPEVSWPARPMPPQKAKSDWDSRIEARYLGTTLSGLRRVGVRIGQDFNNRDCYLTSFDSANPLFALPGNIDPVTRVFSDGDFEGAPRLLPGMLYRYQVANALFDEVSNDIVQVTPLMETIAHRYETPVGGPIPNCHGARIYDPHIAVTGTIVGGGNVVYDLWLLDSMPVVPGARYAYLMVVFNDAGEISTIIPAGEVEIPLNP